MENKNTTNLKKADDKHPSVILADDENGLRKNPVSNPVHPKGLTSTDEASQSKRTSTVTDGEAG